LWAILTKPFIIDYDVSGSGSEGGGVLHQGHGPVAFFSRAIVPYHAKHVAYERDLIGLIEAILIVRVRRPH
jgi:hypothetical protein